MTPYLHPVGAPQVIEFLHKAFGAEEVYRAQSPEGVVHHAQVRIGDSIVGMGDAHGPYQPMPCTLHLYVPDTDALYNRALQAGATSIQPPADQPHGDRSAGVPGPVRQSVVHRHAPAGCCSPVRLRARSGTHGP